MTSSHHQRAAFARFADDYKRNNPDLTRTEETTLCHGHEQGWADAMRAMRATTEAATPWTLEWFRQRLKDDHIRSRTWTAMDLARAMGKANPTNADAKRVGGFLRAMGIVSRKSHGRMVFFAPGDPNRDAD